jgi:predicted enzyme related to lactoylglutathione lyase
VRLPDGPVLVLDRRPDRRPGGCPGVPSSSVFLYADDVDASWRELAGRKVVFPTEPTEMPFGKWALFEDSEGNTFALTERSWVTKGRTLEGG